MTEESEEPRISVEQWLRIIETQESTQEISSDKSQYRLCVKDELLGSGISYANIYRTGGGISEANLYRFPHHVTEVPGMQKIMLDTMEYDKLLNAPETYERLLKLQSEGKIELLTTHIQRDEILVIDDVGKRGRLEALLVHARLLGTRGAIFDVSRFDLARFGDAEDHALIEHIRGAAWKRKSKDALIVATAVKDADVFVTDDKPLTRRLKSYPGIKCEVIDFEEFEKRLANLTL